MTGLHAQNLLIIQTLAIVNISVSIYMIIQWERESSLWIYSYELWKDEGNGYRHDLDLVIILDWILCSICYEKWVQSWKSI